MKITDDALANHIGVTVSELNSMASGKGALVFIDDEDGQWIKYLGSTEWQWNPDQPEPKETTA